LCDAASKNARLLNYEEEAVVCVSVRGKGSGEELLNEISTNAARNLCEVPERP
jgi:hypothetical protein